MSARDLVEIVGVAATCAVAIGLLGLGAGRLMRRASVRWQVLLVAAVAALGTYAGALAIALLMFLSAHDLTVMTLVSSVSAVVAVGVAIVVGRTVAGWSVGFQAQLRALDAAAVAQVDDSGPLELRRLSAELARTQQRLAAARAREARLEESRRELVSWVSHDLRTPLAGLRAMAEALEDGIAPEPQRFHRRIRVEVDRMAGLVDDLFELSGIQAGLLKLAPETVGVGDLVSESLAGADPIARLHRVRLGGHVEAGLEVTADPAGLSRVVSNLLMNAIRHTPADGVVEIRGRQTPRGVELSVTDGCGGLAADEIGRVFDAGWQGDPARTPGEGALGRGAGLGLAIVRGIVEAHRGRVSVENLDTVSGCRFLVTLPAS